MAETSGRGYRWGRTQGWLAIFLGVVQLVLAPIWLSPLMFFLMLGLGVGLLRKRPYGFVLVYVVAGIAVLAGAVQLILKPQPEVLVAFIITVCVWVIPAVMYYPQRKVDFGFARKEPPIRDSQTAETITVEPEQAVAQKPESAEHDGIRMVGKEEWREAIARYRVQRMREKQE